MHSTAPVENWKQRNRHGMTMSQKQMGILQDLRAAKEADFPWVYLDGVHARTLNSLLRYDWAAVSPGGELDRDRYRITHAGLKALKIFEVPPRRYDGICPVCGVRPKHRSANGNRWGYCQPCDSASKREARKLKRPRFNPNRMCSECHERPLYISSTGQPTTWCRECRKKHRAADRKRRHERLLARIAAGEILLCPKCGERPLHHKKTYVYDTCWQCYRDYQKRYRLRRAVR